MTCATENCERLPERNGYCATCNRSKRKAAAPKAKTARRRIPKQSEEGKERMAVYKGIMEMFKVTHPHCAVHPVRYPELIGRGVRIGTEDVHHKRGKEGDLLYDVRYFLAVCRKCHTWIHDNPELAYEQGWSLSRHQTETI